MAMLLRLLCRCLSCERQVTVIDTELELASCDDCGDVVVPDHRYHPEHAKAFDFGREPLSFASPEEVMQRERNSVVTPVSAPVAGRKKNGANGHNGHHGTNGHGIIMTLSSSTPIISPLVIDVTSSPEVSVTGEIAPCETCMGAGVFFVASKTQGARKVTCPDCGGTGSIGGTSAP